MTYSEQRQIVIDVQKKIARVNHKLENPAIKFIDSMELQDEKSALMIEWSREIMAMRAMPEYSGAFKPQ